MSSTTSHEMVLGGCSPTPLASYLKALGVLRLLGEQRPQWQVRGAWRADHFVLKSSAFVGIDAVDRERLQAYFLDEYRPTPIVAPWNGGSGFYFQEGTGGLRDQSTAATRIVKQLLASKAQRLAEYRSVLELSQSIVRQLGYREAPKDERKLDLMQQLRGRLPEAAAVALDAGVVLGTDKTGYAPLLGTGWNDGRLDFTNNFMQRLVELLDVDSGLRAAAAEPWLAAALFGTPTPGLTNAAVGQFAPGGVGGPNASAGFDAKSLTNPWDFVLMLEGAVIFAAVATRRLEAGDSGAFAYPFTVRPFVAGSGAVAANDESQVRAEIWVPLWKGFSTPGEIRALLSEGRATLGRRHVRDGLGFARAVAALGVDRGIDSFQRFGFLERSGKAYLATPLTRMAVKRNQDAELIDQLESTPFLDRLRSFARKGLAPASILSLVHQLENELFELAQQPGARSLQKVLSCIGFLSVRLSKSRRARDEVPVVPLLSDAWVLKGDDGSAEFRIAAALAGLDGGLPLRPSVVAVTQDKHRWIWAADSRSVVWGEGGFTANVAKLIHRRRLDSLRSITAQQSLFDHRAGISSGDVEAWMNGLLDERRLTGLLLGLVNVSIPQHLSSTATTVTLPAAYSVLKPFFIPADSLARLQLMPPGHSTSLPGELLSRLQAGRVQDAVDWAWRRLRAIGFPLPLYPKTAPAALSISGQRLLTALAIPLASPELEHCLRSITHKPQIQPITGDNNEFQCAQRRFPPAR